MIDDLKVIKKKYGEKMARFCRNSFPILLEKPGKLSKLLMDNFYESHSLFDDIVTAGVESDFKNYIYSLVDVENNIEATEIKSPEELMSEVGYDLFECYTEEDIQSYKKYYASGEELCTFNGGRLRSCRVFFAVKKNVFDIRREDFKNPTRQDEYGTSVISIQFTKDGSNTLSIKNRYNHRVNNPDATFSNNLDNIIPGLTDSFKKYKGIVQIHRNSVFEISGYVRANDGKYYKYNYEINNVYYCPNNIIIDNFEVKKYDKSRYLIIDYFIIDMSKDSKSISLYDNELSDSFCSLVKEIKKIDIKNNGSEKKIIILGSNNEYLEILIDRDGKIISIKMDNIYNIGDNFLGCNKSLEELYAPDLIKVGNYFLHYNKTLQILEFPNITEIGSYFLRWNEMLLELCAQNLKVVGNSFLSDNGSIQKLKLPNLTKVGIDFLRYNKSLYELYAPKLTMVGSYFLYYNQKLQELKLPNLTKVSNNFLYWNKVLKKLYAPKLTSVGFSFLYYNEELQDLYAPNLIDIDDSFLYYNHKLRTKVLFEIESRDNKNKKRIR